MLKIKYRANAEDLMCEECGKFPEVYIPFMEYAGFYCKDCYEKYKPTYGEPTEPVLLMAGCDCIDERGAHVARPYKIAEGSLMSI